jgi:adenosine deaminase
MKEPPAMHFDLELIHRLPKTDLHCHLDGSLRVATLLDLARAEGVTLPADTEVALADALRPPPGADLVSYLRLFDLTLSTMQTEEALERTAFELAEDAAHENVWYLEVRFAPILHQQKGLSLEAIVEAVLRGLRRAEGRWRIRSGVIVCGIRHIGPEISLELAELAIQYKNQGVVAFDLAGAEKDYPAKHHREAFYRVLNNNINSTVHAGEAFGARSIHQAIHYCGAHRIGHGTLLWEDPDLLEYVNDHRIPLEMCLTSNIQTGAAESYETHPFGSYFRQGLRVTINTDNRLMSDTTVSRELQIACDAFRLDVADLRKVLINGFKAAFLPHAEKGAMLKRAISAWDEIFFEAFPTTYQPSRTFL